MNGRSNRRIQNRAVVLVTLAVLLTTWGIAASAESRWWTVSESPDYATSQSTGVIVGPDGVLRLGPESSAYPVDSVDVLWAVAVRGDGTVALGGEGGRLFTWTRSRGIRAWVTLPVGQVLSLAADGDAVIAGTAPDGWIYRIGASGDTTRLAETGERYVWGLAPAGTGAWYAATGTEGKLLKVREGSVETVLDSDAANLVSILADGNGGVFAGGDSKGRVFHVDRNGRARTLYEANEDEIRALAWDGHALFAGALSAAAVRNNGGEGTSSSPRPTRRAASRDRSVIYRIVPDSSAVAWWLPPHPMVYAAAATPRGIVFATGNKAGIYAIDGIGNATRWLAPEQEQITGLAAGGDGGLFAVTSHPAALWVVGPGTASRGELSSPVFDAERISRFGRLHWEGDAAGGRIALSTRSGNTEEPDTTWSPWAAGSGNNFAVTSPSARYVQWRVELRGERSRLERVELAMRENNLPPLVANLRVSPQADGVREGRMSTRTEAVTQEFPDGRKVEFSLKRQADGSEIRSLPDWMGGLRAVQWSAGDPNGDALRFDLSVRGADADTWMAVASDLEDSVFVWDSQSVPDGRYRLRVIASDEAGNAIGESRTAEALSRAFTVDNTVPQIASLDATALDGAVRVRGRASDATSPLWRIEVAIDDEPWRAVAPESGILDDRSHAFDVRVPVKSGDHAVRVRVVDRAGNSTTRAVRVTLP